MTLAVTRRAAGGPETLLLETIDLQPPGPAEARVRQTWAGVNFVDVYHRIGLYPLPPGAAVLGVEAAGVVEALGPGVEGLEPGQRVAWAGASPGAYAQARNIPAERLIALPDAIGDRTAAAAMLKGVTAHMVLRRVCPVGRGDTVLVQAAAGGLGLILVQWAKRLGATVIGTAGSEAKADRARAAGADEVILYRQEDFVAAVRRLTGGRGVDAVLDGVGGEVLLRSLDCVRPFGLVVSLGQASGELPAIPLTELGPRRSLAVARPSVFAYAADQTSYRAAAGELFDLLQDGLEVAAGLTLPLAQAAEAHRALEAGRTSGAVLLDLA